MKLSLRALFGLVTLVALYLGWQRYLVSERLAVVRWTQVAYNGDDRPDSAKVVICDEDAAQISWLRRCFGDSDYHWSSVLPPTEPERARIIAAFPQAKIYEREGRRLRLTNQP